jgi:hypothetical protein
MGMLEQYSENRQEEHLQFIKSLKTPNSVYSLDKTFFYCEDARKTQKQAGALFPTSFISEGDLAKWLARVGVDITKFGIGSHRSIKNLMDELKRGETRLVLNVDTQPIPRSLRDRPLDFQQPPLKVLRVIHVANLVIFGPKKLTVLVEESRRLTWIKGDAQYVDKGNMLPSSRMNITQLPPSMPIRDGVHIAASNCLLKEFRLRATRTTLQSGKMYSLSPEEVAVNAAANITKRRKELGGGNQGLARRTSLVYEMEENQVTKKESDKWREQGQWARETATTMSNSYGGLQTACHVHSIAMEISPNRVMYVRVPIECPSRVPIESAHRVPI